MAEIFDTADKIKINVPSETAKLPTKGRLGLEDALGISRPYQEARAGMLPEISAAESAAEKGKQAQSEILAGGKEKAVQDFATAEKKAKETYQGKLEAEPLPAFIPTKDTAQDIAGLFSVISVIGMAIGGGGKMAAQRAMGAMDGMLKGYRQGRMDLYKQQRNEFDANFKTMIQKHQEFRKEMEDAVKLAATNKEAGFAAAELAATKAGSTPVQAMLRKGELIRASDFVKDLQKADENAFAFVARQRENEIKEESLAKREAAREASAERRQKESMAQRERLAKEQNALREKLATIAAEAKGKDKGAALKPGAKITEGYVADTILRADVNGLVKDLQNPKLQEQIIKYRAEAFLTEEGKVLNQLLTSDIPPELQQFLTKVRDIRNNYYLNISGKAVTGGEALRNYGTVPQPGDEPSVMLNKLTGMSDRISDSITLKQQLFNLPELNLRPGTRPNLKPGDDYAIGSQPDKYEVGKVYTDASGNKAKYLGGGNWEEQ
jgi:hypothetical protein